MAAQITAAGLTDEPEKLWENTEIGSVVCSVRPGDGSAREQAASCQRVLGGLANICIEYATKRYRSNLINWGMIPFTCDPELIERIENGDNIFITHVREAVLSCKSSVDAWLLREGQKPEKIQLFLKNLTKEEADIIAAGCLINYYSV